MDHEPLTFMASPQVGYLLNTSLTANCMVTLPMDQVSTMWEAKGMMPFSSRVAMTASSSSSVLGTLRPRSSKMARL